LPLAGSVIEAIKALDNKSFSLLAAHRCHVSNIQSDHRLDALSEALPARN
jgi:hypothetical protein